MRRDCNQPIIPAGGAISPVIFKSEMDYISRCILDYPDIETGGELFGFYTESGIPVILYAIGPGRNANHRVTFFNQDVDYLVRMGRELKDKFGLHHIGEWHSHHRLGLAHPSGHDANTMISTIREKGLGRFLLCIGNCDDRGTTLNPFPCDDSRYCNGTWDVIFTESPVRRMADRMLSGIIENPQTLSPRYSDSAMNGTASAKPEYHKNYWLEDKSNNMVLKSIHSYLQDANGTGSDVRIKLDAKGLVHIYSCRTDNAGRNQEEDIIFPEEFPETAPAITRWIDKRQIETIGSGWEYNGDIMQSFIEFYKQI